MVKPPNFDPGKDYPLLMEIHGGPFGMYTGDFNFQYQVYATNGFIVLYTNPRGSQADITGFVHGISQFVGRWRGARLAQSALDSLDWEE